MDTGLLSRQRSALAGALRHHIAGQRFEEIHAEIWRTPGARWFGPTDPIWVVHADIAMVVGGIRALLLQSLHPVAMLGVSEHSEFRQNPWGRLHNTSRFLATTTYGSVEHAELAIQAVRRIHARVKGVGPEGQPYRADDPALLMWIHAAEVDSFIAAHRAFGAEPLGEAGYDSYVRQTGLIARRLRVVDPPESVAELEEVIASYRAELRSSEPAEEAVRLLLVRGTPLRGPARLGYAVLAAGAVSLLDPWVRVELRLPSLPIADRVLVRPLARQATSTMRWALSAPEAAAD